MRCLPPLAPHVIAYLNELLHTQGEGDAEEHGNAVASPPGCVDQPESSIVNAASHPVDWRELMRLPEISYLQVVFSRRVLSSLRL